MYWKVLYDDGSSHQTGMQIVKNGVSKEVSIDDLDRTKVNQIIVCNDKDQVIYSVILPASFRLDNRFIHRRNVGVNSGTGDTTERYHLVGLNNRTTGVTLFRVYPNGTIVPAQNAEVTLHPPELF